MLKMLFTWLDAHHGAYWAIALGPTLLLGGWILSAGKQEARGPVTPRPLLIWLDAIILFLFLFAWRWPFLLVANEFNPDESQLIAGAITLSHDPIFWRSVDGTTSGPLNFYVLLPLHWLGLPLDYFTARLTGLLLIGGALFACHRALANAFGRAPAWLSILPATAFFATVTHTDLIHFSTEHLPLFLMGLCFWLLTQRPTGGRYHGHRWPPARIFTLCTLVAFTAYFLARRCRWRMVGTANDYLVANIIMHYFNDQRGATPGGHP